MKAKRKIYHSKSIFELCVRNEGFGSSEFLINNSNSITFIWIIWTPKGLKSFSNHFEQFFQSLLWI